MAESAEHVLVLSSTARAVRRRVGATAWAALEELLLDAHPYTPGVVGVHASARSLAATMGLSKDTTASALRRLAAAGLVRRENHRDERRGVFARSVYLLDLEQLAAAGVELRPGSTGPSRPRRRRIEPTGDQGALFESEPAVPR